MAMLEQNVIAPVSRIFRAFLNFQHSYLYLIQIKIEIYIYIAYNAPINRIKRCKHIENMKKANKTGNKARTHTHTTILKA